MSFKGDSNKDIANYISTTNKEPLEREEHKRMDLNKWYYILIMLFIFVMTNKFLGWLEWKETFYNIVFILVIISIIIIKDGGFKYEMR